MRSPLLNSTVYKFPNFTLHFLHLLFIFFILVLGLIVLHKSEILETQLGTDPVNNSESSDPGIVSASQALISLSPQSQRGNAAAQKDSQSHVIHRFVSHVTDEEILEFCLSYQGDLTASVLKRELPIGWERAKKFIETNRSKINKNRQTPLQRLVESPELSRAQQELSLNPPNGGSGPRQSQRLGSQPSTSRSLPQSSISRSLPQPSTSRSLPQQPSAHSAPSSSQSNLPLRGPNGLPHKSLLPHLQSGQNTRWSRSFLPDVPIRDMSVDVPHDFSFNRRPPAPAGPPQPFSFSFGRPITMSAGGSSNSESGAATVPAVHSAGEMDAASSLLGLQDNPEDH